MIIYRILNISNGKSIIGKTTQKPSRRWSQHYNDLKKGIHSNKHLQSSWNTYGESSFVFQIMEENIKDEKSLNNREMFYIKEFETTNRDHGYNMSLGGEGQKGWIPPQEWRDKKRKLMTGKKYTFSEIHRKRISESKINTKMSPEAIAKRLESYKKNPNYKKNIEKLINSVSKEQRVKNGKNLALAYKKILENPQERERILKYKSQKIKKKIVDQYGTIYESISDAAKIIGASPANIGRQLRGYCNHNRGFTFNFFLNSAGHKYIDEEQ